MSSSSSSRPYPFFAGWLASWWSSSREGAGASTVRQNQHSGSTLTVSLSLFCVTAYCYYHYHLLHGYSSSTRIRGGGQRNQQRGRRSRASSRGRLRRMRRNRGSSDTKKKKRGLPESHYASSYSDYEDDDDDSSYYSDDDGGDGDDRARASGAPAGGVGGGAPVLGHRGCAALDRPAVPYMDQFLQCLENVCDPISNPTGCIPLCVAENRLVLDMIVHKFVQMTAGGGVGAEAAAAAATSAAGTGATAANGGGGADMRAANGAAPPPLLVPTNTTPFGDPRTYCYNSFLGMPVARDAAAYFIARHLLFGSGGAGGETSTGAAGNGTTEVEQEPSHVGVDVSPEMALEAVPSRNVVLGTGAAALLSHLFVLLSHSSDASRKECCLIPAPYYAAFDNHCRLVADVEPFGIVQMNPAVGPSDRELDTTYRQAQRSGLTPRFLLITNPNNPLGVVYTSDTIRRLVQWARKHDMHTIVDEVYALSTHPVHQSSFQSVIKVLNNQLGHDVHLLYALSKDFGSSGLRVGMLYTHNDDLLDALPSLNIYTCVPGPIQYLVAELLTDDDYVDTFLETSRNRLAYSYHICAQKLDEMVIPYVPAQAGVFVYADFSSLVPSKLKSEASRRRWETDFGELVFRYARLVMTPGSVQHDPQPGMFRICYGWVSIEVLQIAMERLSRLVAKVRRLDWDDLNDRTLSGVLDVGLY